MQPLLAHLVIEDGAGLEVLDVDMLGVGGDRLGRGYRRKQRRGNQDKGG
jgi:hypothetical protein